MQTAPAFDRAYRALTVVSPHFDDGVFSCGDLLAEHPGSTVITVFGSGPLVWGSPTPWDCSSGFAQGEDAVAARRLEDRTALAELEARPVWLPFWDSQYGAIPSVADVRATVAAAVASSRADAVMIPLGLWHSDHRLAHDACAELIWAFPELAWYGYEDAIYRRFADSGLFERLRGLECRGIRPTRVHHARRRASPEKRRAVSAYHSQLLALEGPGHPGSVDVLARESFWHLVPQEAA